MFRSIKFFIIMQIPLFLLNTDCSKLAQKRERLERFYKQYLNINWICENPKHILKEMFSDIQELYLEKRDKYYKVKFKIKSNDLFIIIGTLYNIYNIKYGVIRWEQFLITKNTAEYSFSGAFLWYIL